ncbi:MAG: sigma-70 family RNA polymerase sigma factor [Candidatus Kapaibacterium sp.]
MFNSKKYDPDIELDEAVENLRKGSAEAFQILYQKYHNTVYRFCLRMLGSESLAKDAFQETFVKVYEKRESFKGDNFAAWLFTISRHICYNMLRAKKEHASFDETYHQAKIQKTTDFGLKQALEEAINSLPTSLRESFILREYEEMSYQEISDVLEIDLSLAKIRVFRARKQLRLILKPIIKELDEHR